MKMKKRHIILAVMVLVLSGAVYINWQFSNQKPASEVNTTADSSEADIGKNLGEAQFVNNPFLQVNPDGEQGETGEIEESSSLSEDSTGLSGSSYFTTTVEARTKAREDAMDAIKEILDDVQADDAMKVEAVAKAAQMAQNIELEANIESLIKAKGFANAIAFIQNGECSIVVSADGLLDSQVITIKDVVNGQAGISFDKIKIIET